MSRTAALRLASEFQVRHPATRHALQNEAEPSEVGQLALIEGEHALIEVAEQVERLDADVRAVQPALQQRPEVFDGVAALVFLPVRRP